MRIGDDTTSKSITVIQGYHFGLKNQPKKHPYINTVKPYNFKITKRTKRINNASKYHVCRVLTSKGKSNLVITKIMHVNGKVAMQAAEHLKPVLNCYNYGMTLTWLYYLLKKNTKASLTKSRTKKIVRKARKIRRFNKNHRKNK